MAASTYNKPVFAGLKTGAVVTLAGYGITDAYTAAEVDDLLAGVVGGSGAWGSITGTLTDQGDLVTALAGKSNTGHSHAFADLTSIPTTIGGYGITDSITHARALARGLGA